MLDVRGIDMQHKYEFGATAAAFADVVVAISLLETKLRSTSFLYSFSLFQFPARTLRILNATHTHEIT